MISVFVEKKDIKGSFIEILDKKDINHLKNSFRIKTGDKIRVVDGEYEYLCSVLDVDKKMITAEINEKIEDKYSSTVKVDIAMGLLKNDKMDLTISKLTEIGINRIRPLQTIRTIVKVKGKKEKWDVTSKEALKQCQGVRLVEIDAPIKLEQIDMSEYDLVLVPYESEEELRIKDLLKEVRNLKKVLYIIGPEGGFDPCEIQYLKENNAKIITLGKRILRAETAAIVTGGILINEL